MAYNVEQLQDLQNKIGSEPVMPTSLSRYNAFEGLKRQAKGMPQRIPQRRNTFQPRTMQEGGQPDMLDDAQNIASKGRYGDTMLMHVNPEEVRGLSSLGPVTKNPETGLPEAFFFAAPLVAGLAGAGAAAAGTAAAATAGAGLMAGLGGMWAALGPIGQGMLIGGGMGGLRSLFMGGENPLKDILLGAAFGGLTGGVSHLIGAPGAVAPGATEAIEGTKLVAAGPPAGFSGGVYADALAAGQRGVTTPTLGLDAFRNVGRDMLSDIPPSVITPPPDLTGGVIQTAGTPNYLPGTTWSDQPVATTTGISPKTWAEAEKYYPSKDWPQGFVEDAFRGPSPTVLQKAGEAGMKAATAPEPWSFTDWWGRRTTPERIGLGLGATTLGLSALEGPPAQAEIPGLRTPAAIPELDPFTPRTPIGGRGVEFYERTIGEGRTPEEAQYFTEDEIDEEDVNVAKEGGLVSLQMGGTTSFGQLPYHPGHPAIPPAPAGYTYAPTIRGYGAPVLKKTSEVGGVYIGGGGASTPTLLKGATMGELGRINRPDWERAGDTSAATAAPEPFKFPAATPFQSNISSFNIEDALARITGQDQVPQVPAVLPEQVAAPISTDVAVPTDTSALGDLLSRFQQTAQVDPIAGLVASGVGVNQGGSVGLARGGVFEGRVQGQGDGMADQIAFNVVPQTPQDIPNTPDVALLSSDEYVVPADVVSMLGNGSSTAGAQALDQFNQLMRKKAFGTNRQQRELNAGRELSSLV